MGKQQVVYVYEFEWEDDLPRKTKKTKKKKKKTAKVDKSKVADFT